MMFNKVKPNSDSSSDAMLRRLQLLKAQKMKKNKPKPGNEPRVANTGVPPRKYQGGPRVANAAGTQPRQPYDPTKVKTSHQAFAGVKWRSKPR
jgi:hypothetical protein